MKRNNTSILFSRSDLSSVISLRVDHLSSSVISLPSVTEATLSFSPSLCCPLKHNHPSQRLNCIFCQDLKLQILNTHLKGFFVTFLDFVIALHSLV